MKKLILAILAAIVFIVPSVDAQWWNLREVKKEQRAEGPTDYEENFGPLLRANKALFPNAPERGSIYWYHIFGIEKDADEATRKKALRKMLLATHPDKGGCPELSKAVTLAKGEMQQNADAAADAAEAYAVEWNGAFTSQFGNFNQRGPGFVHHVEDLPELFCAIGEREKMETLGDNFETTFAQETKEWRQFYISKMAFYALCATSCKFLKKNKRVKQLRERWKRFQKYYPKIAATLEYSSRAGWVALAAAYPLYKFGRFFTLSRLDNDYRSEIHSFDHIENQSDLEVFYKLVTVGWRRDHRGDSYPVKEPSRPVGYMTSEEKRTQFAPVRKAKVMAALTAAESFASAWMGCVL